MYTWRMLNTKLVLGIAGIIVIAGGAYAFTHQASSEGSQVTDEQVATTEKAGPFTGSVAELAQRGGDWKCTVDARADTGAGSAASSGVVYVSGKKVRADFSIQAPVIGSVEAHMVADGEYVYSWSSVSPQGVKTEMADSEPTYDAPTSGQGFDAQQSYSYDCLPAQANASLFIPPSEITFKTI